MTRVLIAGLTLWSIFASADICEQAPYLGFDSRLHARVVGRLPAGNEPAIGFEISDGIPVVAYPHRLVAFKRSRVSTFVEDEIRSFAVDRSGRIFIRAIDANAGKLVFKSLGPGGLHDESQLTESIRGDVHQSGAPVMIESVEEGENVHLVARRRDGKYALLAVAPGPLRAMSFDSVGMAAVANNSALVWTSGSSEIKQIAADTGLSHARDACLVGPDRAVVALNNMVVLFTPEDATILVAMRARCRWSRNQLYLLDERNGLIWAISGIEKLGTRAGDAAYAKRLVASSNESDSGRPRGFLEAARLVGCNAADSLRSAPAVSASDKQRVDALVMLGNQEIEKGYYAAAIGNFTSAIKIDPRNVSAQSGLEHAKNAKAAEERILRER